MGQGGTLSVADDPAVRGSMRPARLVAPFSRLAWPDGLKGRAIAIVAAIYLVVAAPAVYALLAVIDTLTEHYGTGYARDNALLQKEKLQSPVLRELALSRKLAASPLVQAWAEREDDPELRARALAEIDSYKPFFKEHAYFLAFAGTGHYYFADAGSTDGPQIRQTLSSHEPSDSWFFTALRAPEPFSLNVDRNKTLGVTKVWINVGVAKGEERLGIVGTGLDLTGFVNEFLTPNDDGIAGILLDRSGAIQGHENRDYIDLNTRSKAAAERNTIYRLLDRPGDAGLLRDRLKRLENGQSAVETFFLTVEGKRQLVAATFIPEIGWFNLTLVDPSRVFGLRQFVPLVFVLVTSLLVIILVLGALLNRSVLQPILDLTESARQIAAGRYDLAPVRNAASLRCLRSGGESAATERRPAWERQDEIGELTRAFRRMAETVREHTDTLERRVAERTRELTDTNEQLAASNRQILDGIRCAKLIQSAILPQPLAMTRAVADNFVLWRPRDLVGGDFYFLHRGRTGWLIGIVDCTGHGVPGAFMTMLAHAVVSQIIKSGIEDDPAQLLERADETIREMLHGRDESTDAGMEMAVCHIADPAPGGTNGRLTFAGARISLWHAEDGEVREIRGDSRSVGYRKAKRVPFTNHTVDGGASAAFYMTTDGLLDQSGGPKAFGFGRERFAAMIRAHAASPLREQEAAFERILQDYRHGRPQKDDITFLGFRIGAFPSAPRTEQQ